MEEEEVIIKRVHGRDGSVMWGGYPKHTFMLLGDSGCGKSTIFSCFKHSHQTPKDSTKIIDFANRTLNLELSSGGKQKATLQCWDTPPPISGTEAFFDRKYYETMDSLVFVYNNKQSFKSVERRVPICRSKTKASFFLVSNRFDDVISDWEVGERVEKLVKQNDMKLVEISAQSEGETETLFEQITEQLQKRIASYSD